MGDDGFGVQEVRGSSTGGPPPFFFFLDVSVLNEKHGQLGLKTILAV